MGFATRTSRSRSDLSAVTGVNGRDLEADGKMTKPRATRRLPSIRCAVMALVAVITVANASTSASASPIDDYLAQRALLIAKERSLRSDAGITLSAAEQMLSDAMLALHAQEIAAAAADFPTSKNFVHSKAAVDASPLLPVLTRMPKGAVLHAHNTAAVSMRWLIDNATYSPDCYIYYLPSATPDGDATHSPPQYTEAIHMRLDRAGRRAAAARARDAWWRGRTVCQRHPARP